MARADLAISEAMDCPAAAAEPCELTAEASIVRQFASFLEWSGVGELVPDLRSLQQCLSRSSRRPMAVSARLILEVIEAARLATHRSDLGIRFVEWVNPRSLGALSLLSEHCESYAVRHRLAKRFAHLETNAVTWHEQQHVDQVILILSANPKLGPVPSQFTEMLVALEVRRARLMLGPGWKPAWVQFAHPAPGSSVAQQRYFRTRVEYGGQLDAIAVTSADFHQRNAQANPELQALLEEHLDREERKWPVDFKDQVHGLVAAQLANGTVSVARVAALLSMSPRTFQRRLRDNNTDFSQVLSVVRQEIVRKFLASRPMPKLTELSHMLGYTESSSASRFIKLTFGKSARVVHMSGRRPQDCLFSYS